MHTHSFSTATSWWLYAALLAAATFLYFSSVAEHGIDDHDVETFRDNARISQDFSHLFSSDREQITGRPAADLGKWLASLVLGNSVAGYHLLVVFIHMLAALLLARLVDVLHEDRRWAFASGLLFLLNITHFQAVHHISAIDYPLALFWGLLGLLAFLRYDATGHRSDLVATYVFLALGTLTHMAAAALGPLCLLWSLQRGRDLRTALGRGVPLGLALVGLVLYGLAIMPTVTSTWTAIDHYGRAEVSPFSSLRLLAWFGGRLLSTAHWVPPLAVYKQSPWEIYFGTATLTALVGVAWWHGQRTATWVIWIGLCLLPFLFIPEDLILEFLPDGPSRYLYLASAGSSVLIALGLVQLGRVVGRWNNALVSAGLVLIFASSYLGIKRAEGFSHYTSGRHNIAANHFEEGTYRLRRAIREGGDTIPLEEAYFRLAIALPSIGEDPLPVLHEGLELFPNSLFLNLTMAIRESESSDGPMRQRGLDRMRRTRQRAEGKGDGPLFAYNAASVYHNMANHYLERGETALAIRTYNKALELVP
ncbi:MAG: tetratricopeptide (TPR) repeat protein, partial [Planctomycetota bacterium]